jgi:hypothetical protein
MRSIARTAWSESRGRTEALPIIPQNIRDHRYREIQIQDWINAHRPDSFAILDDFNLPELRGRQIQTGRQQGLTDGDAARIIALLS